jgi:outer membrane protein assembly factor BamB
MTETHTGAGATPDRLTWRCLIVAAMATSFVIGSPFLAVAGPATPADYAASDWASFHDGVARLGVNGAESIIGVDNAANLTLDWSFMTGDEVWSSPAVAGGIVYVGSDDKKVYALDALAGTVIWTKTTGDRVRSSASVTGGVVYIGSDDNKVYALDALTGSTIWTATLGDNVENSSPLVANGMVYVGDLDGYFYALDKNTGAVIWKDKLWAVRGSAAYASKTLYVGSDQSKLFALNADTGATVWSATPGGRLRGTPAVTGGVVYVGGDNYRVYAYNASNGTLKWQTDVLPGLGIVRSTPAVWNGNVYVDTGETSPMDSHFYVFDIDTGEQVCNHEMADYATSSVAIANGVAYVGSFSHQLYAFDATDCTKLWDSGFTLMGGGIPSSPAVSNGVVYVGSEDGGLYAFHLSAGPPVGTYVDIGDSFFDPTDAIGHDLGTAVQWTNIGLLKHTATDTTGMDLFDSGSLSTGGTYTYTVIAAGIYSYQDSLHSGVTGTVKAPMILTPTSGTTSTVFTIQWATAAPSSGFVYDVQIQRPGSTAWSDWKTGVTTTTATFVADSGKGTYSFKAHMRQSSTGNSTNYSPFKSIVVS